MRTSNGTISLSTCCAHVPVVNGNLVGVLGWLAVTDVGAAEVEDVKLFSGNVDCPALAAGDIADRFVTASSVGLVPVVMLLLQAGVLRVTDLPTVEVAGVERLCIGADAPSLAAATPTPSSRISETATAPVDGSD